MENNKSELIKALVKFQSEVGAIKKDKKNPFFSSKYADLSGFIEACRPAMVVTGLAITQTTKSVDGEIVLVTTLWHESGQSIESEYPVKVSHTVIHKEGKINDTRSKENGYNLTIDTIENNPQLMGSAFTYARRYCFSAILGVASEADDDANQASQRGNDSQQQSNNNPYGKETPMPPVTAKVKFPKEHCPYCNAIAWGKSIHGEGYHCFEKSGGCTKSSMHKEGDITGINVESPSKPKPNAIEGNPTTIIILENRFRDFANSLDPQRIEEFKPLFSQIKSAVHLQDIAKIELLLIAWENQVSNGEGAKQ